MYFIRHSDNVQETLMTDDDYQELTLQMSTGDFHTHLACKLTSRQVAVLGIDQIYPLLTWDPDMQEFWEMYAVAPHSSPIAGGT